MLLQNLQLMDESALQKLCNDHCPESASLDFKRDLPGSSEKEKQELLKDVCALANSDGGDLIYGIDEEKGTAGTFTPISGELADAAARRLSQVLDAGLEPRVQGVRIHHVNVGVDGYVMIVRVPASFDGPHCLRVNNNLRRFVMRNGTSTTDITFDQLRSAFDRTATLTERARRFIYDRLQLITDAKISKPLAAGPACVVHLVPIAGLGGRQTVDLRALYAKDFTQFLGNDWGGGSRTFNLDGLVVHPGGSSPQGYSAYTHIFRTGALEAACLGGERRQMVQGAAEQSVVWSSYVTSFYRENIATFLRAATQWGFAGPAIVSVALLNVEGYDLHLGNIFRRFSQASSDRPHLILPDVWIDNIETSELDAVVRPLMDMLWQAFGVERCFEFDAATGAYKPSRG